MSDLIYLLTVLFTLAAYVMAGVCLWAAVESVYYLWCKVTGREY